MLIQRCPILALELVNVLLCRFDQSKGLAIIQAYGVPSGLSVKTKGGWPKRRKDNGSTSVVEKLL